MLNRYRLEIIHIMVALMIKLIKGDFFTHWESLEPESIDLILTDPPYNCLQDVQSWDVALDWLKLEEIFNELLSLNGQVVMFCDMNLLMEIRNTFSKYLKYRYYMIWQKTSPMPISIMRPLPDTEFILVFKKKGSQEKNLTWNYKYLGERSKPFKKKNYDKSISVRKGLKKEVNENVDGQRLPRQIFTFPNKPNMKIEERTKHPTQKPLGLIKKLIACYSNEQDKILDPFSGSATTLIGCHDLNRNCLGFELDEIYYNEAKQRIKRHTRQTDLFGTLLPQNRDTGTDLKLNTLF